MKQIVDALDARQAVLVLPLALLVTYGVLRAVQHAVRRAARHRVRAGGASARSGASRCRCSGTCTRCRCASTWSARPAGVSRDIERGTRGISTLLSYMLFSIIPVVLEFGLVAAVLLAKFDWRFAAITVVAVVVYIGVHHRASPSGAWSSAAAPTSWTPRPTRRAIDSLLNYETVKYFNNEDFEARRYDENLQQVRERPRCKNEASLGAAQHRAER